MQKMCAKDLPKDYPNKAQLNWGEFRELAVGEVLIYSLEDDAEKADKILNTGIVYNSAYRQGKRFIRRSGVFDGVDCVTVTRTA